MSLNKKMIFFISGLLIVLLLGTFTLNLSNTKAFLQDQLHTHAQDTATSLGLSLSTVADLEDTSNMETMINAVFDRGYYAQIELLDIEGNQIYLREKSQQLDNIPMWFIELIEFKAPIAQALVQSGWIMVGNLNVQSNPGYAYIELWNAASNILAWFSLAALIAIGFAFLAIRAMLKPLKLMTQQAEAIVKKEYILQENLPKTLEFKNVVVAMNGMVFKIKETFDRDAKIAQKLQKLAYQDSVTDLSNRTHFEMTFDALLDIKQETSSGAICLIRIEGLKTLNDEHGYLVGNKMMKHLSESMVKNFSSPQAVYARLNGTELITVLPTQQADEFISGAETLVQRYPEILKELSVDIPELHISVALMNYQPGESRNYLLAQLDLAIKQAALKGPNSVYYHVTDSCKKTNTLNLEKWLTQAITEDRFTLFQQPSFNLDGQIQQREVLIRLKDEDGTLRSAGYFMPVIEKLNKKFEIDALVIQMVLSHIKKNTPKEMLAINLSQATLDSKESIEHIFSLIEQSPKQSYNALAFELSEALVTSHKPQSWPLMRALKTKNISVGIDQFGRHFADMRYLQELHPDYVKLDVAFAKGIDKDPQTQAYISSLCEMASSLDIKIIAMAVENDAQVEAFKALGVSDFQGYHFGAPSAL